VINLKIQLVRATLEDADLIWNMQIEAFAELLAKYQDMDTSPGNEPLEKVIMRLKQPFTYFYLIKYTEDFAGAIRVVDKKEDGKSKRISPIFVLSQFRKKGIAQQVIMEVEKIHGNSNWELDTIQAEKGNCYLYEKMGYRQTGKIKIVNDKMTLVFYTK
jgi:GNAT superfamily N-acetyltransferase